MTPAFAQPLVGTFLNLPELWRAGPLWITQRVLQTEAGSLTFAVSFEAQDRDSLLIGLRSDLPAATRVEIEVPQLGNILSPASVPLWSVQQPAYTPRQNGRGQGHTFGYWHWQAVIPRGYKVRVTLRAPLRGQIPDGYLSLAFITAFTDYETEHYRGIKRAEITGGSPGQPFPALAGWQ